MSSTSTVVVTKVGPAVYVNVRGVLQLVNADQCATLPPSPAVTFSRGGLQTSRQRGRHKGDTTRRIGKY